MKQYLNRRILAAAVCFCLAFGLSGGTAWADTKTEADYEKTENIYARLSGDGSVKEIYAVNDFELKKDASITDYGTYSEVKNLTDLTPLSQESDRTSFSAKKGSFYYQGRLPDAELPWLFSIKYKLDGKSVSPEQLAGKSGALSMELSVKKNPEGAELFYKNYVMQISMTLDGETCSDIHVSEGTLADAGGDRALTVTVLPGKEADVSVKAEVQDFEMTGISVAAVPYSMELDASELGTDQLTGKFSQLTDAVAQLKEGTEELEAGMKTLDDSGSTLLDGAGQITKGLSVLDKNSQSLTSASSQIHRSLKAISSGLSSADLSGLDDLNQLPQALEGLSGALRQMESGLNSLYSGFSASYQALDSAMEQAQTEAPTEAELAALEQAVEDDPQAKQAYEKLKTAYEKLNELRQTYQAVKPGFAAVSAALAPDGEQSVITGLKTVEDTLSTISGSAGKALKEADLSGMVKELRTGMSQLSSGYAQFHKGLLSYTKGVSALAEGSGQYQKGLSAYLGGIGQAAEGTSSLSYGMREFYKGIGRIPGQLEAEIDEMMEQYSGGAFDPVSFVDQRNEKIKSVQFIFSTEEIKAEEPEEAQAKEDQGGFWDRLKNLFS
ncbi:hypothetical protein LI177_01695 [bacterium 210820-DFI.6.37]|nr:hypothetical protein [bacterium 210820-DFI.6.37]